MLRQGTPWLPTHLLHNEAWAAFDAGRVALGGDVGIAHAGGQNAPRSIRKILTCLSKMVNDHHPVAVFDKDAEIPIGRK